MPRLALLLRGYSYFPDYLSGGSVPKRYDLDCRPLIPRFIEHVYLPLSERFTTDVYFVTFDSPVLTELTYLLRPAAALVKESGCTDSQLKNLIDGLSLVRDFGANIATVYDAVLVTRFDLIYLQSIARLKIAWDKFNFLFREYEELWREHNRICDTFYCFAAQYLSHFIDALTAFAAARPEIRSMHEVYPWVEAEVGKEAIHFIFDSFHDSNPDHHATPTITKNPFYRIYRGELVSE